MSDIRDQASFRAAAESITTTRRAEEIREELGTPWELACLRAEEERDQWAPEWRAHWPASEADLLTPRQQLASLRAFTLVHSLAGACDVLTDREHGPIGERVDVLGEYVHRGRLVDCTTDGRYSLVLLPSPRPRELHARWIATHATRLGWSDAPSPRRRPTRYAIEHVTNVSRGTSHVVGHVLATSEESAYEAAVAAGLVPLFQTFRIREVSPDAC